MLVGGSPFPNYSRFPSRGTKLKLGGLAKLLMSRKPRSSFAMTMETLRAKVEKERRWTAMPLSLENIPGA